MQSTNGKKKASRKRLSSGHEAVDRVHDLFRRGFSYDTIPHSWDLHIVRNDGKPDYRAQHILAYLIGWHRPRIIKDASGKVTGLAKRFRGDFNIRKAVLEERFRISESTLGRDLLNLQDRYEVIRKDQRTLFVKGKKLSNVLHIFLDMDQIERITYAVDVDQSTGKLTRRGGYSHPWAHPTTKDDGTLLKGNTDGQEESPAVALPVSLQDAPPGSRAPFPPNAEAGALSEPGSHPAPRFDPSIVGEDVDVRLRPSAARGSRELALASSLGNVGTAHSPALLPDVFASEASTYAAEATEQDAAALSHTLGMLSNLVVEEYSQRLDWLGKRKARTAQAANLKDVAESVRRKKNGVLAELLRVLFFKPVEETHMKAIRRAVRRLEKARPDQDAHRTYLRLTLAAYRYHLDLDTLEAEERGRHPVDFIMLLASDEDALEDVLQGGDIPAHLQAHTTGRRAAEERLNGLQRALLFLYQTRMEMTSRPPAKLARLWETVFGFDYGDPLIHLAGLFVKHTQHAAPPNIYMALVHATVLSIGSKRPLLTLTNHLHDEAGEGRDSVLPLNVRLHNLLSWALGKGQAELSIHLNGRIRSAVEDLIEGLEAQVRAENV